MRQQGQQRLLGRPPRVQPQKQRRNQVERPPPPRRMLQRQEPPRQRSPSQSVFSQQAQAQRQRFPQLNFHTPSVVESLVAVLMGVVFGRLEHRPQCCFRIHSVVATTAKPSLLEV